MSELFASAEAEDLMKFGLIPEFIGRVPVLATLDELDEEALMAILTEPKNALLKQYQKLFEMDGVKLKFTEDGLRQVAAEAILKKTGARGLRGILEDILVDVMYEIPSQESVRECIISDDVVARKKDPILVYESESESA